MVRCLTLVLVCLGLACGGVACAPPRVGPTAGSGYVFAVQVSNATVWLGPVDASVAAHFPKVAAVIVTVQDAQGRPVDGVPVTFELEPEWAGSIALAPSQTSTRGGIAQAILSESQTIGVVHVMARVDNVTAQARLTVQRYVVPAAPQG